MLNLNPNTAQVIIDSLSSTQEVVSLIEKLAPGTETAGLNPAELVNALETALEAKDPTGYSNIVEYNLPEQDAFSSIVEAARSYDSASAATPTIDASSPYAGAPVSDSPAKASTSKTETREATAYSSLAKDVKDQVNSKVANKLDTIIQAAKAAKITAYLVDSDKMDYLRKKEVFTITKEAADAFLMKYEAKVAPGDENKAKFKEVKDILLGDRKFKISVQPKTNAKIVGVEISSGEDDANVDIVSRENLGTYLLAKYAGKLLFEGKPYAGVEVTSVVEKTTKTTKSGSVTKLVPVVKFVGKADIINEDENNLKVTSVALDENEAKAKYNTPTASQSVRSELSFKITDGIKERTVKVPGKVPVPFYDRLPAYVDVLGALTGSKRIIDMSRDNYENYASQLVNLLSSDSNAAYAETVMDPELKAILDLISEGDTTPEATEL